MDSPSNSPSKEKELKTGKALDRQLSIALGSMAIASPAKLQEREEDDKAFIRNRRRKSTQAPPLVASESLLSLSTSSNEIVARLLEPGVLNNSPEEASSDNASRIVRWQETIASPIPKRSATRTPGRSPMPGTLIPPTPESSFTSSTHDVIAKEENISTSLNSFSNSTPSEEESVSSSRSSATAKRAAPLSRTMSTVERDLFVSKLTDESCATIYIIPKVDVDDVVGRALSLKYFTAISMNDDEDDPHALIILGRDEDAVNALFHKIEKENSKALGNSNKEGNPSTSTFKTAAGAAVIGAVTTWAGLAFS